MKNLKNFENQEDLTLVYANASFSGYGHNKVTVELEYKGKRKAFIKTTTDLEAVDEAKELGVDSWEDSTFAFYEIVANHIEDQVSEWIQDVDFKIENENEED